jgi:hypothetical protein
MNLPNEIDFPAGSKFYIKEFDVPLVRVPNGAYCKWYNWFGGKPKEYPLEGLKPGNNWEAESYEEWLNIVRESL